MLEYVLNDFGFTLEEIRSDSRKQELADCRHYIHYLLRETTKMNLREIGEVTNRTKTPVRNSLKKINNEKQYYKSVQRKIDEYLQTQCL